MKKIILLIAFAVSPMFTSAQSIFDTLEDMDGVDVVVISRDAFDLISKFKDIKIDDNEGMKIFSMVQDLNEFKMFATEDVSIAKQMSGMVKKAVKQQKLIELMRVKDDDSRVKIYVKSTNKKDYVSEVLMHISGVKKHTKENIETLIISLTGNIDVNNMSDLANTFMKENKIKVKTKKN